MVVRRAVLIVARLEAHVLQGNVGYNLVGVHVGAGACTSLNHVHGELVVILAGQYVLTSSLDTLILGIGKQPELMVCLSSSPLCVCQTVDEQRILAEIELTD